MMKKMVLYTVTVATIFAGAISPTVSAAACSNANGVLLFPAWFRGLDCVDNVPQVNDINQIWIIVMNIAQWLIIAGGYVALYFIIWSGFKYITSTGDPQKIVSAKNTLLNAIIGLVIVLASVAIIQTIQTVVLKGVIK